jgi:hypothetical protein
MVTLYQHVRALRMGPKAHDNAEANLVMNEFSDLRLLDVDSLAQQSRDGQRTRLVSCLRRLADAMRELSRVLTRTYLTHVKSTRARQGPPP